MNLEEIKRRVVELSANEREEIYILLSHMRQSARPEWKKLMAERLDDKDPAHWLTVEEFERRLGPE